MITFNRIVGKRMPVLKCISHRMEYIDIFKYYFTLSIFYLKTEYLLKPDTEFSSFSPGKCSRKILTFLVK